ncbi:MAG: hypothetical protein ABSH20_25030, partial [Tepidisphaeraceae bacterium]
ALGDVQWPSGSIVAADREALVALGLPQEPVAAGERIICAADVWKANAVYFERLGRLPDGASWYVGPAEMAAGTVGSCVAVKAEEVLRGRPDLQEVLQFPEGFLVVISAGTGLGAVLDPQDRDLFAKPNAAPTVGA